MPTYYVRKTGSDSNDGSTGTPWLTIHKAITTAAAGDTIKVGNGVYQENSASAGFLNIATTFATALTIEAEDGEAGNVVIQGSSSATYNVRETVATKITWSNIQFIARVGSLYTYEIARLASTIIFNDCYFEAANAANTYAVAAFTGTGSGVTNTYTFTRCTFYHPFTGSAWVAEINSAAANIALTFSECRLFSNSGGIRFLTTNNSSRCNVTNGTYESTRSGSIAFLFGTDGAAGSSAPCAGTVTGARFKGVGHAFEIGAGGAAVGVTASKCFFEGTGDFAVVLKDCDNATLTDNIIRLRGVIVSGTPSAVFTKGSRNSTVTGNTIICDSGHAFANWNDATGYNTSGMNFSDNNIILLGASNYLHWNSARDAGSNLIDENVIVHRGTGNLGTVFASSGITTLSALQSAWSAGGYASNSLNDAMISTVGSITPTQITTIHDLVAAIKAKTDNLPTDPADASDIAASFSTVNTTLGTIAGYIDTEVAAIKAKTDNLPSDPADQSAVEAAITAAQTAILAEGGSGPWGGLNASYTVQVRPALASGSEQCNHEDRRKYNLEARKGDTKTFSIPVYEDDGVTPFDFTGMTLRVVIEPGSGSTIDRQVIENANITVAENVISFTTSTCNAIAGVSETLSWALQKITTSPATKVDLLYGDYYVRRGVVKD